MTVKIVIYPDGGQRCLKKHAPQGWRVKHNLSKRIQTTYLENKQLSKFSNLGGSFRFIVIHVTLLNAIHLDAMMTPSTDAL